MKRFAVIALCVFTCLSVEARRIHIEAFLPDKGNGAAVIVCPGGSYHWLARNTEGRDVARKLRDEGFAAYVLFYRTAGVRYFLFKGLAIPQTHYPAALEDLQEAIAEVRSDATSNGVDTHKIGVMGFSAGGHLVLNAGEDITTIDGVSTRPDFIVSVYPVITMSDEKIVHERSRKGLLGRKRRDPAMRDSLSMEKNIPRNMPPVFIVNCKDDPTVDYRNSEVMAASLRKNGTEVEYHQFETGGHGFGASSESAPWFPLFLDWYNILFDK